MVFAIVSAFSTSYIMFAVLRFFTGLSLAGLSIISIVLSRWRQRARLHSASLHLTFHLRSPVYRRRMVWRRISDVLWDNHRPGLDSGELAAGWNCILCKWVEDAHSGSVLAPHTGHSLLEVLSLFCSIKGVVIESRWTRHWTQHVWRQVASRVREVAPGQWEGGRSSSLYNDVC